jgi:hypothetical protein
VVGDDQSELVFLNDFNAFFTRGGGHDVVLALEGLEEERTMACLVIDVENGPLERVFVPHEKIIGKGGRKLRGFNTPCFVTKT